MGSSSTRTPAALPALQRGGDGHDRRAGPGSPAARGRWMSRSRSNAARTRRVSASCSPPADPVAEAAGEAAVSARLSLALSSRIRPRSWWTKRRPSGTDLAELERVAVQSRRPRPGRPGGSREQLDERGLARAVVADQCVDLAGCDLQLDVVERLGAGECLGQVLDPAALAARSGRSCSNRSGGPPAERSRGACLPSS